MSNTEGPHMVAGVGSEAVRKATGRSWGEWLVILDDAGARQMAHAEIAKHLHQEHGLDGWWSQMVTVGYEQERGMRDVHQKGDSFEISRSKTVGVAVERLYHAWADTAERARWLPGHAITIRRATPAKSMRVTWSDGVTSIHVNFYAKGPDKSQVTVQHVKLADAPAAEEAKTFWSAALDGLKAHLET